MFTNQYRTGTRCKRYRNSVNVEFCRCISNGTQHSAPVGICSEHCTLKQRRTNHALCNDDCRIQILCTGYRAFQQLGSPFAILCKLSSQVHHDNIQCLPENGIICILFGNLCIASQTGCHHHTSIIGGLVAIDRQTVISYFYHIRQSCLQQFRRNCSVCGDTIQSRCHVRVNHSAALCHAAEVTSFSVQCKGNCHFFRNSICGHNCSCCL